MNDTLSIWLRNIRKMRGMTLDDVSSALDGLVSKQAISKYERGLMSPSKKVMESLCRIYKSSPDTFLGKRSVSLSKFSFRSKEAVPLKVEQRIMAEVKMNIEHYIALEELFLNQAVFRNPIPRHNISNFDDIEKASVEIRKKWNLGNDTIASVCRTLEQVGIIVLEFEWNEEIDGLCGWINKKIPFIALRKNNVTVERKRFTALHELAHILFPSINAMDARTKERMCHRFASSILLPKDAVAFYIGLHREKLSISELSSIRTLYGISVAAIVHRLKDLSVISEKYYNHIFDNRIKHNPMEEEWGKFPFYDEALRYKALVHRAEIELPGYEKKETDIEIEIM